MIVLAGLIGAEAEALGAKAEDEGEEERARAQGLSEARRGGGMVSQSAAALLAESKGADIREKNTVRGERSGSGLRAGRGACGRRKRRLGQSGGDAGPR